MVVRATAASGMRQDGIHGKELSENLLTPLQIFWPLPRQGAPISVKINRLLCRLIPSFASSESDIKITLIHTETICCKPSSSLNHRRHRQPLKKVHLLLDSLATLVFEWRQQPENGGYAYFGSAYRRFMLMTSVRRWAVLSLYAASIGLSLFLFYLSILHCHLVVLGRCATQERQKLFSEHLAVVVSCVIASCSSCWLVANYQKVENSCLYNYNFLEMPTAVLCSLLAGICGVVEIHFNFDDDYHWTQKWAMITADAVALVFLHAGLAFALT